MKSRGTPRTRNRGAAGSTSGALLQETTGSAAASQQSSCHHVRPDDESVASCNSCCSVRNAAFIFTYVSHIGPSQELWMGLELLHVPVIMKLPDSWKSAVCDEDLLFKNACGCSICRPSLGRWGWSATSLCLTSRVISPSQRRVRMLLICSVMGIHKD